MIRSPRLIQQLTMRHNLVGMPDENFQQLVFDACQMYLCSRNQNSPLGEIYFNISCAKD